MFKGTERLRERAAAVKAMPSLDAYETLVDDLLHLAAPAEAGLDVERLAEAFLRRGFDTDDIHWEAIAAEYARLARHTTGGTSA